VHTRFILQDGRRICGYPDLDPSEMIRKRIDEGIGVLDPVVPYPKLWSQMAHSCLSPARWDVIRKKGESPMTSSSKHGKPLKTFVSSFHCWSASAGCDPDARLVTDFSRGQVLNQIYGEFFGKEYPTRTRVQVAD
jgi:hypothetical protein